jgi:hypothetical protein
VEVGLIVNKMGERKAIGKNKIECLRNKTGEREAIILVLAIFVLVILSSVFVLAVSQTINVHGKVTNSGGTPVSGTQTMVFSLYTSSSEGSPIWSSGSMSVQTDSNGVYSVDLDLSGALKDFDNPSYLGVSINGDPEMTPRINITSVPSAITIDFFNVNSGLNGLNDNLGNQLYQVSHYLANWLITYTLNFGQHVTDFGRYFETRALTISSESYRNATIQFNDAYGSYGSEGPYGSITYANGNFDFYSGNICLDDNHNYDYSPGYCQQIIDPSSCESNSCVWHPVGNASLSLGSPYCGPTESYVFDPYYFSLCSDWGYNDYDSSSCPAVWGGGYCQWNLYSVVVGNGGVIVKGQPFGGDIYAAINHNNDMSSQDMRDGFYNLEVAIANMFSMNVDNAKRFIGSGAGFIGDLATYRLRIDAESAYRNASISFNDAYGVYGSEGPYGTIEYANSNFDFHSGNVCVDSSGSYSGPYCTGYGDQSSCENGGCTWYPAGNSTIALTKPGSEGSAIFSYDGEKLVIKVT